MLKLWSPLAVLHVVSLVLAFQDQTEVKPEASKKTNGDQAAPVVSDESHRTKSDHARSEKSNFEGEPVIRKLSEKFQQAFNDQDATQLIELFGDEAQIVSAEGHTCRGREEIEKSFTDYFENNPEATVSIEVETIRSLSATLAIEEGTTTTTAREDGPDILARYTVIYSKTGDDWQISYARDTTADEAADENIRQLGWLVGDWMDESQNAIVMTNYRWADNRRFIEGEFHLHSPGYPTMDGTVRIGWDPQARQLRSWIFDSEGGFATGLWSETQDGWMVKITGVMRDGQTTTATNTLHRESSDHMVFSSTDRTIGGIAMPDGDELSVVRSAPAPEEVSAKN